MENILDAPLEYFKGKEGNYPSFGRRLSAFLIDIFIMFFIEFFMLIIHIDIQITQWLLILIGWIFCGVMESSERKGSIGKILLRIQVTDLSGKRLSLERASIRYLCKYLSALILLAGFVMAIFTLRKQALHDIIVGSIVVKAQAE